MYFYVLLCVFASFSKSFRNAQKSTALKSFSPNTNVHVYFECTNCTKAVPMNSSSNEYYLKGANSQRFSRSQIPGDKILEFRGLSQGGRKATLCQGVKVHPQGETFEIGIGASRISFFFSFFVIDRPVSVDIGRRDHPSNCQRNVLPVKPSDTLIAIGRRIFPGWIFFLSRRLLMSNRIAVFCLRSWLKTG